MGEHFYITGRGGKAGDREMAALGGFAKFEVNNSDQKPGSESVKGSVHLSYHVTPISGQHVINAECNHFFPTLSIPDVRPLHNNGFTQVHAFYQHQNATSGLSMFL